MRNEILTDGDNVYMVLFPTINGVMAINEEGERRYFSYPAYKGMRKL